MRKTIAVDVDGVLAKLLEKWLQTYNMVFGDNIKVEDVVNWDMKTVVKEEARPYINNFLNLPEFYRDLEIIEGSRRVLEKLSENYDIIIVTDPFTKESLRCKFEWLQEHFPFIHTRNFVFTGNKSVIYADYLIDDGVHNLETFKGYSLLYDAPYNKDEDRFYRVKNWQDIEHLFEHKINDVEEFYKA